VQAPAAPCNAHPSSISSSPTSSTSSPTPFISTSHTSPYHHCHTKHRRLGGIRGEFQLKKGPKLSMTRKLITPTTDFLVFTEIRADQRAIKNTKLKYNLRPSHFSASQHPRGGVLICANQQPMPQKNGRKRTTINHTRSHCRSSL